MTRAKRRKAARHSVTLNAAEERLVNKLSGLGVFGRGASEVIRRLVDDQLFELANEGFIRLEQEKKRG